MCGIAGVFQPLSDFGSLDEARQCVENMTDALVHRGPDDRGVWADPQRRCVLGNRRLSVLDLSDAGKQPMTSHDGRWVIAFNGEIYNTAELRDRMPVPAAAYRGHSDTEVLVNAVAHWQTDSLSRLDGMFAFAAFDTLSGQLILARDPFGEKPLYYTELPKGGLAFASELGALEVMPGFDGEVSVAALAEYFMFEYIGAPRTIYRRVRKLQPGHFLHFRAAATPRLQRYFEFKPDGEHDNARPIADLADELEATLLESIRRRVVSDVPLGAFLSGGVDSSTVCALIRRHLGIELKTFSTGFAQADQTEHRVARKYATLIGSDHHEQILDAGEINLLADMGRFLDEPCSDWSCLPVYLLSGFARRYVTVAISGDGGDELFAGYDRYRETLRFAQEEQAKGGGQADVGQHYYNWGLLALNERALGELFGAVPHQLGMHLEELRRQINQPRPALLDRMRASDVANYLPGSVLTKVDRMSMQHSLEVRTPFLNVELARFAEKLPPDALCDGTRGKRVLRELAYRYLPADDIELPKKGFGLPGPDWAREEIGKVAKQTLLTEDSRLMAVFGAPKLEQILDRSRAVHRWWALCVLESWFRNHPVKLPRLAESE